MSTDETPAGDRAAGATPAGDEGRPPGRGGNRALGWLRESVLVVASALVLSVLIKTFLAQAFFIPSGSMEDTLEVGDRVLVSKLTPRFSSIERGDIVVFVDPGGWLPPTSTQQSSGPAQWVRDALTFVGIFPQDAGRHLIKRVIGTPGDNVACCDPEGRVSVNGVPIDEPYLADGAVPSQHEFGYVVPEGRLWVMGDNRQHSADSRAHLGGPGGGTVPIENVEGTAFVIVWPLRNASWLPTPDGVFAEVPSAPPPGGP